jgi:hypothetical protein
MTAVPNWEQCLGHAVIERAQEQCSDLEAWWAENAPNGPSLAAILGEGGPIAERITKDALAQMARAAPGAHQRKRDLCALAFIAVTTNRDLVTFPVLIAAAGQEGHEYLAQPPNLHALPARILDGVCEAHRWIAKLRTDEPIDVHAESATTAIGREAAQALAAARHKDNRADREFIRRWYVENRGDFPSKDRAAEYAVGGPTPLVSQSFRTVRDWMKGV